MFFLWDIDRSNKRYNKINIIHSHTSNRMDNNNDENYEYNDKYASIDDANNSNSDKITVHVNKNDTQIYRKENDDNKLATIVTDNALNPFTASMDMWQNYVKAWTDSYKQLFFKNQTMTNGEFWFMYYRFDSKPKKQ